MNPTALFSTVERRVMDAHRAIYTKSNGRLLGKVGPLRMVKLTTTGRRTGQPRSTMLIAPHVGDDQVLLVASNSGAGNHPAWYLNLRDEPSVELDIDGEPRTMTARTLSDDERADAWPRLVRRFPTYAIYQLGNSRQIPVVALEPAR